MEFEPVIGLEIHVEMKTNSKMFSSAPVTYGKDPNTQTSIYDLAFPGVMPTVNKQAVINAIRVCHALHMSIDDTLMFERKNYFYSDLSKGYQITQQFRPIGRDGFIQLNNKKIGIERAHLEEDACKQLHTDSQTLLDYNRSGIPLIEIVTKPELRNGTDAARFVEEIRSIVSFLGVSDGKIERGSLRCDVNVSVKQKGASINGVRTEIKNVSGFANIEKAIDYEIERQIKTIRDGGVVKPETRRYSEKRKATVLMRAKTDPVDYKYFTDTHIPPIKLSKEFIDNAIATSPELASSKRERFLKLGLDLQAATLITEDAAVCRYFEETIKFGANPTLAFNWICMRIPFYLKRDNITIDEFKVTPKLLAELLKLIEDSVISDIQAREIFTKMLEKTISPTILVEESDIRLISDENLLRQFVLEVFDENPKSIVDFKNGNQRALEFIVGQVMKKTNGKANPSITSAIVSEEIKRR